MPGLCVHNDQYNEQGRHQACQGDCCQVCLAVERKSSGVLPQKFPHPGRLHLQIKATLVSVTLGQGAEATVNS